MRSLIVKTGKNYTPLRIISENEKGRSFAPANPNSETHTIFLPIDFPCVNSKR